MNGNVKGIVIVLYKHVQHCYSICVGTVFYLHYDGLATEHKMD